MIKTQKISNMRESFGIALGILAAVIIFLSQTFYYDYVVSLESKNAIETSQRDIEDDEPTVLSMGHQGLSSVVEFSLQQTLLFISTIYQEDNHITQIYLIPYKGLTAYFQALFRLIISPNAP